MSYAPATLLALAAYYATQGGANDGIVGSLTSHCAGYHLGGDRINSACACKPAGVCKPGEYANDYSLYYARDKAGLTNAAMAIDLGLIGGQHKPLQEMTAFLLAECEAKAPDTLDIRELIGSLDGTTMFRWDFATGRAVYTADPSHLNHTHLGYFRDTEKADKTPLLKRYFGGDMVHTKGAGSPLGVGTLAAGASLCDTSNTAHRYPQPGGGTYSVLASVNLVDAAGKPIDIDGKQPPVGGRDQVYLLDAPAFGAAAFGLRSQTTFAAPPAPTPLGPGTYKVG